MCDERTYTHSTSWSPDDVVSAWQKKMAVIPILVAGLLVLCTTIAALVRALYFFRRPAITEANVLDRKHKSKCGAGKDKAYKVAIIGAGKLWNCCHSWVISETEWYTFAVRSGGIKCMLLEINASLAGWRYVPHTSVGKMLAHDSMMRVVLSRTSVEVLLIFFGFT